MLFISLVACPIPKTVTFPASASTVISVAAPLAVPMISAAKLILPAPVLLTVKFEEFPNLILSSAASKKSIFLVFDVKVGLVPLITIPSPSYSASSVVVYVVPVSVSTSVSGLPISVNAAPAISSISMSLTPPSALIFKVPISPFDAEAVPMASLIVTFPVPELIVKLLSSFTALVIVPLKSTVPLAVATITASSRTVLPSTSRFPAPVVM